MIARKPTRFVTVLLLVLVLLLLVGWLGLRIKPRPFPPFPPNTTGRRTIPLPEGLPVPVERFYQQLYGDTVPVIESAVVTGRATLRVSGVTLPARFRFTHEVGQAYRHYIETTFFGLPLMKINENFLGGKGRMELPFGISEGAQIDQGANLALWAEAIWFPALWITDPRVRWEAIDEETALLVVPFGEDEQNFVVRFSPDTGMLQLMESMRYKDAAGGAKILWLNRASEWTSISGSKVPAVGAVTWFDEGTPWALFRLEDVVYNVDVEEYIQATGP